MNLAGRVRYSRINANDACSTTKHEEGYTKLITIGQGGPKGDTPTKPQAPAAEETASPASSWWMLIR